MGTGDVEAAGSINSEPPNDVPRPGTSQPVVSYMFGSAADLRIATHISINLIQEIRKARNDSAIVVLNFRALQALRIDEMQEKLLELSNNKLEMLEMLEGREYIEPDLNEHIDALLHQYALALRDYETLSLETVTELVPEKHGVVWVVKFNLRMLKKMFNKALNRQSPGESSDEEEGEIEDRLEYDERLEGAEKKAVLNNLFKKKNAKNNFREVDKAAREARDKHKASSERLWMGSFGGLALIVPMLIMVLHRSVDTSLIVTSVGTVLFAFALALAARTLKGMDVLAATAAYAAVLVVFVGTSLPPVS